MRTASRYLLGAAVSCMFIAFMGALHTWWQGGLVGGWFLAGLCCLGGWRVLR